MAAADARAALLRSRVVARGLLHAAQVLGLAVLLRALAEFPWVAAAAPSMSILRVAASFLSLQRVCYILANGIVIGLAIRFVRDAASFSPTFADASGSPPGSGSSSSSNGDVPGPEQHPFLKFLDASRTTQQQTTEAAEPSGEEEVFEDKHAVHVKAKARAQPPRRTVSEKTTRCGGGGVAAAAEGRTGTTAAVSPSELRRAKSENGRRRKRRSAAAAPAAAELVTDDEAFRLLVEAFISKQQTLFREESLIGAGKEDGPALAGAAAVAVK